MENGGECDELQSARGLPVRSRPSRADLAKVAEEHQRALKLHCYRMSGSLHEAEDAVQETMLRAWRGFDDFEARASIKNWLYRRNERLPQRIGKPFAAQPVDARSTRRPIHRSAAGAAGDRSALGRALS